MQMTAAMTTALEINRAYYEAHANEFCQRTASLRMDAAYEPFLKEVLHGGHILDAGCGSGRDAAAFLSCGYRVTAIDASPAMVKAAKHRGISARTLSFQRMTFSAEFDGIWACASLLHVPHAEMPAVLRRFARALKPEGIFYASLKEGSGERIAEDGRFFSYFSLDEFSNLLTREGLFEMIRSWKNRDRDSSGTMRPWLNFLAARRESQHHLP